MSGKEINMPASTAEANARQQQEWYERNNDKKKKLVYERRRRNYRKFLEYKFTLKCERCGFDNHVALDFHHIDPALKDRNISSAVLQGWSLKRVMKEIDKCIVLCANCHRIEHADIAQRIEQGSSNPKVAGSNPAIGA